MMAKTFLDNVTLHIRHMLGHLCSLIEPVARLYCPLALKVDVYLRKETEEEVQFFFGTQPKFIMVWFISAASKPFICVFLFPYR